eukprot:Phypoly_transcript_16153.p1 GENE.Phypoly_transcript_16153~~Phypoly_transcript_16153.p1  ORF type:complete len:254 (+),score=39.77 Phypoly_transcript_16153:88-849(+)
MKQALLLVLVLVGLFSSGFSSSCTYSAGGYTFNLDIGTFTAKEFQVNNPTQVAFNYRMNLCQAISGSDLGCTQTGSFTAYQTTATNTGCMPVGGAPISAALLSASNPTQGLKITMANKECCTCKNNVARTTTITFNCGATSNTNNVNVTEDQGTVCQYSAIVQHPNACGKKGGPGGGGGLSPGSIFLIIFFSAAVAYLIGGFIVNWKVRGASPGIEAIPQVELWRQVPGLVVDGFVFTKNKILAMTGRGYTQL